MLILVILSITMGEINKEIEENILQPYNGTVQAVFIQDNLQMKVIKSGNEMLIRTSIGKSSFREGIEKLDIIPSEELVRESREKVIAGRKKTTTVDFTLGYYDGKNFHGISKDYFVSFILYGHHAAYHYVVKNPRYEGSSIVADNDIGYNVEFNRSTKMPEIVRVSNLRVELKNWKKYEGFGYLPQSVETYVNGEMRSSRKLESVSEVAADGSYLEDWKADIQQMEE